MTTVTTSEVMPYGWRFMFGFISLEFWPPSMAWRREAELPLVSGSGCVLVAWQPVDRQTRVVILDQGIGREGQELDRHDEIPGCPSRIEGNEE